MAEGTAREILAELLSNLVMYTKYHFAWEEQLLKQHGFPELEAHRAEHRELTRQVLDLRDKLAKNQLKIGAPVLHFLRHWLVDHICAEDKIYGSYLRGAGGRRPVG